VDFDPVKAKAEGRLPEGMDEATAALFPSEFEESALGLIPKGWKVGTVNFSDAQCVDDDLASKTAKFSLKDGDVVIAMTGATIGKTGIIVTDGKNPYLNQRVAKFESKLKGQTYTWFVFVAFQYGFIFEQVVNAAQGSAQPNISTTGIESVRLVLPSNEDLLLTFNDIVTPLFLRWIDNQKQSQTLTTLRDTLLPRLISGQLRLNQAQQIMGEVGA
jgi:type I restriction enzyme S subunit